MRIRNVLSLALLLSAPAMATVYNPPPQHSGLYEAYSGSLTDYLYTTSASEAAGTPGYSSAGVLTHIERFPQTGTTTVRRYWKGPPQNDHIYLTDNYPAEISYVLSNGYVFQGIEGYVYTQPMPGSQPVYRMNYNYGNGDLVHRFVRTDAERLSLIQQGWGYDHELGYVPGSAGRFLPGGAILAGYPNLPGGAVVTRRCNAASTPIFCGNANAPNKEANWRDNFYGYRSTNVFKPAGTNVQKLQLDLYSMDFFGGANEHVVIGLHGGMSLNESNIERSWFEGLSVIVGATQCGDGRPQIEVFWRTPGGVSEYNGHNVQTCPAGTAPMQNNQPYRVVILVSDGGEIRYTISPINANGSLGAAVATQTYQAASHFPNGVPTTTSYFIAASTSANRDYTLYMSNLSSSWQNGF
jgi:hypothetical protein